MSRNIFCLICICLASPLAWANYTFQGPAFIHHRLNGSAILYSENVLDLTQQSSCAVDMNLSFDYKLLSVRYIGKMRMVSYVPRVGGASASTVSFPMKELALSNQMRGVRIETEYNSNISTFKVFKGKEVLYMVTIAFDVQKKPISVYIQYYEPIFGSKSVEYYEAYCGVRISELGLL